MKMRKIMAGRKFPWRVESLAGKTHLSQGALASSSRANLGLLPGGLSSMALKRLNSSSGKAKVAPIKQNGLRFPARCFQHEVRPIASQGLRRAVNEGLLASAYSQIDILAPSPAGSSCLS